MLSRIADIFPNSTHVMIEELDKASDGEVWEFAREYGYTIVTKDSDFNDMAVFKCSPPKVIWIKTGNCRVADIEMILKVNEEIIKLFVDEPESAILEI